MIPNKKDGCINNKDKEMHVLANNKDEYLFKSKTGRQYMVTKNGKVLMSFNGKDWVEKSIKEDKNSGYFYFRIGKQRYSLHRVVATAFCKGKDTIDPDFNQLKNTVDHLHKKKDNGADDLEWVCQKENNRRHVQRIKQ